MEEKIPMEELYKEMDMIQDCITRMTGNSFRMKEWFISLTTLAITILLSQECDLGVIGIFMLVVTCVFWGLDAFFLKTETLYRWKYEWVIEKRKAGDSSYQYDLNPHNKNTWKNVDEKREDFLRFAFSKTLLPLYGTVALLAVILLIVTLIGW